MFVNWTHIKNFETEKTRNECLQLMFASVSHEFRTPLNAFTNSIFLLENNYQSFNEKYNEVVPNGIKNSLKNSKMEESNEKFFKICKISSKILLSLIEDILDLAKIEAGTFSLWPKPFQLKTLVEEIDSIFSFQWAQKRIFFKVDINERLKNSMFCSDLGRIKQILMNLISNAYKFTQRGGITLEVRRKLVSDEHHLQSTQFLAFKVVDTGVGIAKSDIPNLFQLFGTISKHKWRLNSKGTGLGLTISKKLTESLGGKISIKSQEEIGTESSFTIKECLINDEAIEENKEESKHRSELHREVIQENIESLERFSDLLYENSKCNNIMITNFNHWDLKCMKSKLKNLQ